MRHRAPKENHNEEEPSEDEDDDQDEDVSYIEKQLYAIERTKDDVQIVTWDIPSRSVGDEWHQSQASRGFIAVKTFSDICLEWQGSTMRLDLRPRDATKDAVCRCQNPNSNWDDRRDWS